MRPYAHIYMHTHVHTHTHRVVVGGGGGLSEQLVSTRLLSQRLTGMDHSLEICFVEGG